MTLKNDEVPDLRNLNTFLAVVDQRSLSGAARMLGISQPSVSQQLKRLEAWVGRPLFSRAKEGLTLTNDGYSLLVFARALVATSNEAYAHFHGPHADSTVRIGLNEVFAFTAVPKVLSLFASMHAKVDLVIETSFDSPDLFEGVDRGRLDLAVGKSLLTQTRGDVLATVPLVWMAQRPDMPVAEGPVPLVTSVHPSPTGETMFEALRRAGRTWTVRLRSQNLATLDAAVSSGLGFTASMAGLRTGHAVLADTQNGLPPLTDIALCLTVNTSSTHPAVQAFAAFMRQVVVELDIGMRTNI